MNFGIKHKLIKRFTITINKNIAAEITHIKKMSNSEKCLNTKENKIVSIKISFKLPKITHRLEIFS